MDQRGGVDHLHGCHKALYCLFRPAKQTVGLLHEHGTKALAAGPNTVIHGFKNRLLMPLFLREIALYNFLYLTGPLFQFLMHLHLPQSLPAG